MSEARRRTLARIAHALSDVPAGESAHDSAAAPRYHRSAAHLDREQLVALFAERVGAYDVEVRCLAGGDVREAVQEACARRGVRRLLTPTAVPERWRPHGPELIDEAGLDHGDLDALDGVLTGCAVAIALTGTIGLDAGADQGRRAVTLVPDYHLCVVEGDRIVATVPEALERLAPAARRPDRPITLISGPSATSDIELVRVDGVHGPRTLDVLIVT